MTRSVMGWRSGAERPQEPGDWRAIRSPYTGETVARWGHHGRTRGDDGAAAGRDPSRRPGRDGRTPARRTRAAAAARELCGDIVPLPAGAGEPERFAFTRHRPRGVVGAITQCCGGDVRGGVLALTVLTDVPHTHPASCTELFAPVPYGGVKASGNTREGPAWTIREMSDELLVVVSR